MAQTENAEDLSRWIGKAETRTDTIRIAPARIMEQTLDRDPVLTEGDPIPPLWHWLYFLDAAKISELGRDGHPALGRFIPPVPLPRRMWAGGRFSFERPLRIGAAASKTSTIKDVVFKTGRSGELCFVTIRHEIRDEAGEKLCVEDQDLVFREDPRPDAPQPDLRPLGSDWPVRETFEPKEVTLFRYSALTFNGHRIHYDRDYARDIEGHDGLVVHGPLIATLLADLAVQVKPGKTLTRYNFRAVAPIFDRAPFSLNARDDGDAVLLAAGTPGGHLAMEASAEFSD